LHKLPFKNYSTDSNSSKKSVILPNFSRPGLWSIQILPNISHHRLFFRIVIISRTVIFQITIPLIASKHSKKGLRFSTHLPVDSQMVIKASNNCRTDISQPYSDNFCWNLDKWRKSSAIPLLILNKNALGAKFQSICHEFGRRWFCFMT